MNGQDYYNYFAQQRRMNALYPQSPTLYPQPSGNLGINWVQGVEGAKAFQIPPGANAVLLDSENDGLFYIKTSDEVGMCKMRTFRYQEIQPVHNAPDADMSQYIRKDELPALILDLLAKKKEEQNEQPLS